MRTTKIVLHYLLTFRPTLLGLALGFGCICCAHVCVAQRAGIDGERSRMMERIEPEEAVRRMQLFRMQRLVGDFCFQFQLEHKPRKGPTVRHQGILYGSWNERGPVSRFKLFPEYIGKDPAIKRSPVEMIVQNGASPQAWMRCQATDAFVLITDGALFEPVFAGVLYTPFDLQMPFVFWDEYLYEGPVRVLSRIGQRFLMQAPIGCLADQNGITAVRIVLDDAYDALLQVDVLEQTDRLRSRFTVRGLKKIQGQHIVKEIELKDVQSKDATSFKVKAASLGLIFDDAVFDPNSHRPAPEISAALFDML